MRHPGEQYQQDITKTIELLWEEVNKEWCEVRANLQNKSRLGVFYKERRDKR